MWAIEALKYLGMYFDIGKTVKVNTSRSVWNFYALANNILSYTYTVNDITRLHLVETYCLPLITYGLNCIFVSVSQLRKYSVCCNSVFKRLFGMHMWESVKEILNMLINAWCISLVTFISHTMFLYNGAVVILKQVISLNVCAMSTVLIYMIICYLVVYVISIDYSVNSNLHRTCCSCSCKHNNSYNTVRLTVAHIDE